MLLRLMEAAGDEGLPVTSFYAKGGSSKEADDDDAAADLLLMMMMTSL